MTKGATLVIVLSRRPDNKAPRENKFALVAIYYLAIFTSTVVAAYAVSASVLDQASVDMTGYFALVFLTIPPTRALQTLITLPNLHALRAEHLVGTTASPLSVLAGFTLGRLRADVSPIVFALLGLSTGCALNLDPVVLIPVIIIAVVAGPSAVLSCSYSTPRSSFIPWVRFASVVTGFGSGVACLFDFHIAIGLALSGLTTYVLVGLRSIQSVLAIPAKPAVSDSPDALASWLDARTSVVRVLSTSAFRSGEYFNWFGAAWLLAVLGLIFAIVPIGVDVATMAPIAAAFSMLSASYSLRSPWTHNAWSVQVPQGLRRDLTGRVAIWIAGTSPCWIIFAGIRAHDGSLPGAAVTLWLFAVCAVRSVSVAPRLADPRNRAHDIRLQLVTVLTAGITAALVEATWTVSQDHYRWASPLFVVTLAATAIVYGSVMRATWADGSRTWFRVASMHSAGG